MSKLELQSSLQVTNFRAPEISIPPAVFEQRKLALRSASEVTTVADPMEQAAAVAAMQDLKAITSGIEKSRVELKEPFLKAGKTIDATAKEFVVDVEKEYNRITRLVSGFQEKERQRVIQQAEENRRAIEEQNRQEAERQRKIAEGAKPKEVPRVAPAPAPAPYVPPARMEGMTVSESIEIEVLDLARVYAAHPEFVKMELRLGDVKTAVKMGLLNECPGLLIKRGVKAGVR